MIKENELRINNWYKSDATGLTEEEFVQFTDWQHAIDYTLNTSGIRLTDSILLKCGFYKLHHMGKLQPTLRISDELELHVTFYEKDNPILVMVTEQENDDENIPIGSFVCETAMHHIKHLHQLQNLYLVLTGTELNIVL